MVLEQRSALENVPAELRERRQWVCWRYEERGGKRTKVPVSSRTGTPLDHLDPNNQRGFEEATQFLAGSYVDGVGFVFTADDPFCGVDLDGVLDPDTGEIEPWAQEVIETLDSYTEISPSGTGVKVIVRSSLTGGRNRKGKIEMYDQGRFFTVTGQTLPGHPATVKDRGGVLAALYHETFGDGHDDGHDGELPEPVSPPMEDEEILRLCRRAKNGAKFAVLFDDGTLDDHGGDYSKADFALVGTFAFYTQNPEQIDRLFRGSALYREKWDEKRGVWDYGERTIRRALQSGRDFYGAEQDFSGVVFDEGEPGGDADDIYDTMTPPVGPTRPDTHDACDTMTPPVAPLRYRVDGMPFPLHALSPTLRRYLGEAAHAKEAPVEFVAVPMIAALGTAIGASRRFRIERTWLELPTLYTAVVALPASGKSPAEDAAMLPVYRQGKVFNQEYRVALENYKREHQAWEQEAQEVRKKKGRVPEEPEKPVKKRIRVGDATVEALQLRMVENPRGLVLARDELAGFFNSLNQYRQGADREFWLSQHSGRVPAIDRKSADESYDIDFPCVSVVGSIQPEKLKVLDIEAGDGMVERFLFAWPDARRQPDSEQDVSVEAENAYREVWDRLYALEMEKDEFGNPAPRNVPLSPEAVPAWKAYKRALKDSADEPGVSSFMRGVLGKMKAHLPRLALILALVRTVEDGEYVEEVREEDLDKAWELAGYFVAQSYRVYTEFKKENKDDLLAYALGQLLDKCGGSWEGSATELFDALKELKYEKALPKSPDALTQAVGKAARNNPSLIAEKGQRSAKARSIVLKKEYSENVRDRPAGNQSGREGGVMVS